MRRLIHILPLLLSLTGCVYSYDAGIDEAMVDRIAIDGNLRVGAQTTITVSAVKPLSSISAPAVDFTGAGVWIEGENSEKYAGTMSETSAGQFNIDTRGVPEDIKYRLHVELPQRGRTYVSDWVEVQTDASIDSLYFDPEGEDLNFYFDISSVSGRWFRWYFDEEWEYTSEYNATLKYERTTWYDEQGEKHVGVVSDLPESENRFYCWNRRMSKDINMMTTDNMSVNRLEKHKFNSIPVSDNRISYVYRVSLYFFPVSEAGYHYWTQVRKNSNTTGSLFSPVPSESRGNIHCIEDEKDYPTGFFDASREVKAVRYYYDIEHKHYRNPRTQPTELTLTGTSDEKTWTNLYFQGMLPVYPDWGMSGYSGYYWGLARCADCTQMGGDKNKPADWPTTDK